MVQNITQIYGSLQNISTNEPRENAFSSLYGLQTDTKQVPNAKHLYPYLNKLCFENSSPIYNLDISLFMYIPQP